MKRPLVSRQASAPRSTPASRTGQRQFRRRGLNVYETDGSKGEVYILFRYTATAASCGCPSFKYHDGACKHVAAFIAQIPFEEKAAMPATEYVTCPECKYHFDLQNWIEMKGCPNPACYDGYAADVEYTRVYKEAEEAAYRVVQSDTRTYINRSGWEDGYRRLHPYNPPHIKPPYKRNEKSVPYVAS